MALRFDIGALRSPVKQANGWLRVDGLLTRAGVFTYRNPDGTERREYRPPAEVFRADSLSTFGLVPVTNLHPPGLLDAANTAKYQVGTVGESVHRDGDFARASLLVTDASTVAAMEAGRVQLSCGYEADMVFSPGEIDGERYDAIQTNIRGNHVALVDVGRAGSEARVRLDGEAEMVSRNDSGERVMKIIINGVEFEVSDQAGQAIARERQDAKERIDTAAAEIVRVKRDLDTASAKLDAAVADKSAAVKAHADAIDPAKFSVRVNERVALLVKARAVLGDDPKFDALDDHAVRLSVLGKLAPDAKFDGKSIDYVSARFDAAIESNDKINPGLAAARLAAEGNPPPAGTGARTDASDDDGRGKMIAESRAAGRAPLKIGASAG